MALGFNEETHTYTVDGCVVPSVTQVLREWVRADIYGTTYYVNTWTGSAVREETFRAAAEYGKAVHLAAKAILTGRSLNDAALHPSLRHPVQEIRRWVRDYNVRTVFCEQPLYSMRYGYAGTPDVFCFTSMQTQLVCFDIKTGGFDLAGPQTAAYEQLYREQTRHRGRVLRYVLHLPKDGSPYRVVPMTGRGRGHWKFFAAKLTEHQLREAA